MATIQALFTGNISIWNDKLAPETTDYAAIYYLYDSSVGTIEYQDRTNFVPLQIPITSINSIKPTGTTINFLTEAGDPGPTLVVFDVDFSESAFIAVLNDDKEFIETVTIHNSDINKENLEKVVQAVVDDGFIIQSTVSQPPCM